MENLRLIKRERNGREVAAALSALEKAAGDRKNVMPFLVDCCKAYATIGEMARVFRDVFGEFDEPSILIGVMRRDAPDRQAHVREQEHEHTT